MVRRGRRRPCLPVLSHGRSSSRPGGRQVSPRQRKGILLLLFAGVSAVGVLVSVSSYVSRVRTEVGPMTTVLRLRKTLVAFQPVTADDVEQAQLPRRWAPRTALQEPGDVLG